MKARRKSKAHIQALRHILTKLYESPRCNLDYGNDYQLLIATMLSAQCTDKRVNIVTKELFKAYPHPQDLAVASQKDVLELIHSVGLANSKSKNIMETAHLLCLRHQGKVPCDMEDLCALPGVGRKTANLIRGELFDIPSIIVDTHVSRVTHRLGLSTEKDPNKIEQQLIKIIPDDYKTMFCHHMVYHGRAVCTARNPVCSICAIAQEGWCVCEK